jgi:hypothetical protein
MKSLEEMEGRIERTGQDRRGEDTTVQAKPAGQLHSNKELHHSNNLLQLTIAIY